MKRNFCRYAAMLGVCTVLPVQAAVYACQNADGSTLYTSEPDAACFSQGSLPKISSYQDSGYRLGAADDKQPKRAKKATTKQTNARNAARQKDKSKQAEGRTKRQEKTINAQRSGSKGQGVAVFPVSAR
ncbi:DUF4124 domain-containing protein [Neisseria animalis]|nr:DUF4124 domain-containing protein [Neisseria animalis]VEE07202.1 Uncharacterised protein [Neisseria animalis]